MQDVKFEPLFWFFGIVGALVALVGAGLIFGLVRLLQEHWH